MAGYTRIKDPDAVLDYGPLDWSSMMPASDSIISATATCNDAGITIDSVEFTTTTTTVWLSGGVAGTTYKVIVHVTTTQGREDDRTMTIQCKEQ